MIFAILVSLFSISGYSFTIDGIEFKSFETIDGMKVYNTKIKDFRYFYVNYKTKIAGKVEKGIAFVENFPEKCNQEYKKRRKKTSKDKVCKFHNDSLIESVVVKEIKSGYQKDKNEIDRYIIERYVYNKGEFHYNELAIKKEYFNEKKQKVIELIHNSLNDDESKKYLEKPIDDEGVFNFTRGKFVLTQINEKEFEVDYTYFSKNDHWLLNKDMVIGRVSKGTARGAKIAVETIRKGLSGSSSVSFPAQ